MYDSTAMFMATKLKEFCEENSCTKCPFSYHPILVGVEGEARSKFTQCGLDDNPSEWNIPEEDRT